MIARIVIGAAALCLLAACNEPARTSEGAQGSYGASSGPNANDPDARVAAQDRDPLYDEPQTGAGSEFGEHMPSKRGENEPVQATQTP